MLKLVRRIMLLLAVVTMAVSVMMLRGIIDVEIPDGALLLAGIISGVVALGALAMEFRRAVYHPEPEDPPGSDHLVMPKDPEAMPAQKPVTPAVTPVPPAATVAPKKIVTPKKIIDKTAKAVEQAESFTHKANGRVRINLDVDEDDEQDD